MRAPVGVSVAERRPNKRLKLPAPGCGRNCVCALANSRAILTLRGADEGRRRSLSAAR